MATPVPPIEVQLEDPTVPFYKILRRLERRLTPDASVKLCVKLLPEPEPELFTNNPEQHRQYVSLCAVLWDYLDGILSHTEAVRRSTRLMLELLEDAVLPLRVVDHVYTLDAAVRGRLEHVCDDVSRERENWMRTLVKEYLCSGVVTPEHRPNHGKKALVTPLQAAMIVKIAESEYTSSNGKPPNTPGETLTWAMAIIETPQDQGVFTSLLNAKLVSHSGGPKQDATVALTESGFKLYKIITQ